MRKPRLQVLTKPIHPRALEPLKAEKRFKIGSAQYYAVKAAHPSL
jgi:hypothetical protein